MSYPRPISRFLAIAFTAIALTPGLVRAQRDPRLAETVSAADAAWNAGKYGDALARYQDVLRQDSSAARVMYRVATLLARGKDFDRSITLFRKYVILAPSDVDGRIGLARALAWSGRYDESVATCDSVLGASPRNRDAALLAAQALSWSGNLEGAIARYERWLAIHPADADARSGLAKLRSAEAAIAPSLEPTFGSTNDSDNNRSMTYLMRGSVTAPWRARVVAEGSYRIADLASAHGTAIGFRGTSAWTPLGGRWTVHGELGVERLDASDGLSAQHAAHVEPLLSAALSGHLTSAISLGGSVVRGVFDETASVIFAGVATTEVNGEATVTPYERLTVTVTGGRTALSGGSGPNTRIGVAGSARWSVLPSLSVATGLGTFGYEHLASDGYFAPRRYMLAEGSIRWRLGDELGWSMDSEIGLGHQAITGFGNSMVG
ncbi:MAG: hypothetical protein DMD26_18405, partial [Gemmatimonadetes bacterium]